MNANVRTGTSGQINTTSPTTSPTTADSYITASRDTRGNVDVNSLVASARKDLDQGKIDSRVIHQLEGELKASAHPFDQAQFREAFKSELNIQDTLTYQGKLIAVGSGIDRSQQIPAYASDALFRHTNEQGVVEVTNEYSFIDPPATPATEPTCNKPFEKFASAEWKFGMGRKGMGHGNPGAPEAKLHIHDGTTKSDAEFAIGEKAKLGEVTVQLTGYAENTVDEGSVALNEKGALVTSYGISGRSGFGLASVENQDQTAKAKLSAFDTEFEFKTEGHLEGKTGTIKGTQTTAAVNLNLLDAQASQRFETKLGRKDVKLEVSGELQAGPGFKLDINSGALRKNETVEMDASILRGKINLNIETRNSNCD